MQASIEIMDKITQIETTVNSHENLRVLSLLRNTTQELLGFSCER